MKFIENKPKSKNIKNWVAVWKKKKKGFPQQLGLTCLTPNLYSMMFLGVWFFFYL